MQKERPIINTYNSIIKKYEKGVNKVEIDINLRYDKLK